MRWHTFLWDFQSLRWCSREQYPSDLHAAHICFAASEQDESPHCGMVGIPPWRSFLSTAASHSTRASPPPPFSRSIASPRSVRQRQRFSAAHKPLMVKKEVEDERRVKYDMM
jgi:hypothetical protein